MRRSRAYAGADDVRTTARTDRGSMPCGHVWARNRVGGGLEMGFGLPIDERA